MAEEGFSFEDIGKITEENYVEKMIYMVILVK